MSERPDGPDVPTPSESPPPSTERSDALAERPDVATERPDAAKRRGWTGGRIASLIIGIVLGLISLGSLAAGGVALWADRTQRDAEGYVHSSVKHLATATYALTSGTLDLRVDGPSWVHPARIFGDVRIRVTPSDPERQVFVGIARTTDVNRYLMGVGRARVTDLYRPQYRTLQGGAPTSPPGAQAFWTASATGAGTQALRWHVREGEWTVVVMNTDAARDVDVRANVGAKIPSLLWVATGLLIAGAVFFAGALALIVIPINRAGKES